MGKLRGYNNRLNKSLSVGGVDEMVRVGMVNELNRANVFQDEQGRELVGSPYHSVKRTYALYLIRNGLQPNGQPE